MRTRAHSHPVEGTARVLATAGESGAVWTVIAVAAATLDADRRSRWLRAAPLPGTAVALNFCLKLVVRRRRPDLGRRLPPLARAPSQLSFPSAHATSSFAAAAGFGRISPGAQVPLLALATGIALTRPYLGMHYPSDVLAGTLLGVMLGEVWPGLDER
jgi:membrane-associated phospholipid phosphatase